ncbi:hypothetical protein D3C76_348880 [compost metagenome]
MNKILLTSSWKYPDSFLAMLHEIPYDKLKDIYKNSDYVSERIKDKNAYHEFKTLYSNVSIKSYKELLKESRYATVNQLTIKELCYIFGYDHKSVRSYEALTIAEGLPEYCEVQVLNSLKEAVSKYVTGTNFRPIEIVYFYLSFLEELGYVFHDLDDILLESRYLLDIVRQLEWDESHLIDTVENLNRLLVDTNIKGSSIMQSSRAKVLENAQKAMIGKRLNKIKSNISIKSKDAKQAFIEDSNRMGKSHAGVNGYNTVIDKKF